MGLVASVASVAVSFRQPALARAKPDPRSAALAPAPSAF
eukprot:CAMPEP_0185444296 /NCGR_PEP_ID=MMETSP1365-20130426/49310_1 /TAXON_ID=38817 /ORGANISM="Gephyrocapsa oceanica, Strain RCC1303" /LENGTH=38 /DNA_ID= /DNA_START= /DNA_END= /DNA_ORIENTATION=